KEPKPDSPPRVEVTESNPLKETPVIEALPIQENKEEHILPTPIVDLVSEPDIVHEPPIKESETQQDNTQTSNLNDQGVAQVQPNLDTDQIEAEKDATQHVDVEHSVSEQHSSPHNESQAEHIMDTDEFINESSAGYTRTPKTGDSQEQDGTVVS
ncbi:hypothetical protein A2U01_0052675, partial [Trifolium medium]|nr:hypothetical protein [Trifolium medium]